MRTSYTSERATKVSTSHQTADATDGTLSIVDIGSRRVAATLDAKLVGGNRVKFIPDGRYVMISMLRGNDLIIHDVSAHKEFKRIQVGTGAAGILMDPFRSRAFVACSPDHYIAIIDLNTFKVIGHLDVGPNPDGMAWSQRRRPLASNLFHPEERGEEGVYPATHVLVSP